MKKICMIAYTDYEYDSRIRREAEALVDRGDMVDFIGLNVGSQKQIDNIRGVRIIRLNVGKYQGSSKTGYLKSYSIFFIRAFLRLTARYIKYRYQVIQIHTMPDFLVFISLIPRIMGAKLILDVHDLVPELYMSKFNYNEKTLLIRFLTFIEKRSIKFAHKAIAVHRPHLEALIRHGNRAEKFIVLLNVPDSKLFFQPRTKQYPSNKEFRLIYHGTISKRHGLELAIRALKLVGKEIPIIKFDIIGTGDDLKRLMRLTDLLGLNDIVHFYQKAIPADKIMWEIYDADVGVIPLIRDEFTKFMLPVKLLEYVQLGIPVICTRTETIEAYFESKMVHYLKNVNAVEIAKCIKNLYYNPYKRKRLALSAKRFLMSYNWNEQKIKYYKLIDDLVESNFNGSAV